MPEDSSHHARLISQFTEQTRVVIEQLMFFKSAELRPLPGHRRIPLMRHFEKEKQRDLRKVIKCGYAIIAQILAEAPEELSNSSCGLHRFSPVENSRGETRSR